MARARKVEVVSRFKSAAKQKETLAKVAAGEIDVIVGTHRLLSKDVKFKDLGLVIIDEEQRFGVEHKEKLKRLRATVHVLTMTATPIPRTLHQALLGIREISNLETPPPERMPVETRIIRWDDTLIKHAVHREMNRGGQVYFVHNRVFDINEVAARLHMIEMISTKNRVDEIIGTVMRVNSWRRLAPSIVAASYNSRGTPCSPARMITA